MKVKNNKRGFITNDLITIIVVCLVLFTVIATMAYQSTNGEKYRIMKYSAYNMGTSIAHYKTENETQEAIYLQELIDNGVYSSVKNPFNSADECSPTESYVRDVNSKKYVTLKCGSYLIDDQYIGDEKYTIYKVGPWHEGIKGREDIQTKAKYNLLEDGKEVYPEYLDESLFIYTVNKDNDTSYNSIIEINRDLKVIEKPFYRTKIVHTKRQD